MQHSVEVVALSKNLPVTVRRLSARRETRGVITSGVLGAAGVLAVGLLVTLLAGRLGTLFFAPGFAAVWVVAAAGAAWIAVGRARRRGQRYRLGVDLGADAFALTPAALLTRQGAGYALGLQPGMTGEIDNGRAPLSVEGLVANSPRQVPFDPGSRATVHLGQTTFVVRWIEDERAPWSVAAERMSSLVGLTSLGAAVLTLFCTLPAGAVVSEADMRPRLPANASPWEHEKEMRLEAQQQAFQFHQCFDAAPIACQRMGYVGVGVNVGKDGEIRDTWISRSTFEKDCNVTECMADVAKSWVFDPIGEPMRVVLPVQVLRTLKPLPSSSARGPSSASQPAASLPAP